MRSKMLVAAMAAAFGASGTVAAMPAAAQTASTSTTTDAGTVASADTATLRQLQQQIGALQAKVEQLQQQQQQPTPAVAPAPAAASDASAWADSTTVSGTSFIDFSNLDQTSNGAKTAASGTGLDVKRFYLSVTHQFNDIWSANITTDFNYVSNDSETQLFVKKAYLQGAFNKLATLRVGSADMPWIPFVENWYGYRFVENTLIDREHFGNSADWGVHLLGDNGTFDYQVSMVNGGGYKNPTRSDSVDFEGRVGFQPVKGLIFAVGGYSGDLGKDTDTSPALHDAHRVDALTAWNAGGFRLGGEYFQATDWNNVTTPLGDAASGWSVWSSYDFGAASLFARYDSVKPSKDLDPSLKDTYYNAGVAFPVAKGVRLAVAYKNEQLSDDTSIDTKTREFGVWGEVKW